MTARIAIVCAALVALLTAIHSTANSTQLLLPLGRNALVVQAIETNIVRVHLQIPKHQSARTLVVDPHARWPGASVRIDRSSERTRIATGALSVTMYKNPVRLEIDDADGKRLLWESSEHDIRAHAVRLRYAPAGAFYGIDNTSLPGNNVDARQDIRNGLLRNGGGTVSAGRQGDGGAPLAYTSRYGILIDSDGGAFTIDNDWIAFTGDSRADIEFFVIVGDPKAIMRGVADISGHPPMIPKWSLGFLNSQWGSSQRQVERIVSTYRAKHIPLDAFILDFDWKAWGEDDYGEWRWNSTHGAGNVRPDLFPGGASGKFGREMEAAGVKLAGIFKPRILLSNSRGTVDAAAKYAFAHHLFFSWQRPYAEYFSGRRARDIDFAKAAARTWFWQHTLPAYHAGIAGFWNDEADAIGDVQFPNFQHENMERAMYDGARAVGNERVWSLNRNFYLGAQRYAYGEWSGDIETSFDSMREQAIRMLGTIDLGEPHWSMDTGGFDGHPSPENYSRWMQFAALTPIMRVHGTYGEKRQPWVYGPQAQAVATAAIDLRYRLLPYIYAYEWQAHTSGVGVVRPLVWDFTHDKNAPYVTDEWMFGEQLLAAPVLGEGQAHRSIYLPKGIWFDFFRGTRYQGPETLAYGVDARTWNDMPLFVREGAIIPMQPVEQYTAQHSPARITLEIFPSRLPSSFLYYDDDGHTYAYEHGAYFQQQLRVVADGPVVRFRAELPSGTFRPALRTYELHIHGIAARQLWIDGRQVARVPNLAALEASDAQGWTTGRSVYGPTTYVNAEAGALDTITALP